VLRAAVEGAFGGHVNNEHTGKDARQDVFALAMLLLDAGCAWPRSKGETRPSERMFEASDTLSTGLHELQGKVLSFNSDVVEPLNLPARMFGAELNDDNEDKDETERHAAEYVAATDDMFHETGPEELDLT
jgi:hypothetical protein